MYHICLDLPEGKKIVFYGVDYQNYSDACRAANLYSIIYQDFGGQWAVQKTPGTEPIPDTKTA